jgi:uncharacterized MAPEG superfamily protein
VQAGLSTELLWLTLTILMTALIWVPYIINRMREHGPWPALWNPQPDTRPKAPWAERLMRAHANAVETGVFCGRGGGGGPPTGPAPPATAAACGIYFFVRLAHMLLYAFAVPLLRSVAFLVGVACQMTLGLTLLGAL